MTETKKFNYSQLTKGQYKVSGLNVLTTNSLKTIKGLKIDVLSGILYLAPHFTAGAKIGSKRVSVCPNASAGCMAGCLYRSGAALIYKKVNLARVRKTRAFVSNPAAFMIDVVSDVAKIERAAVRRNLRPAVRLNGTSDLRFERIAVIRDGARYRNIMLAFPEVTFYDYTKRTDRGRLPANYSLTFSRSEDNERAAVRMLARGINVAAVFYPALPVTWNGYAVINGDLSDVRFLDPNPRVIGFLANGKARKDMDSGFVIRTDADGAILAAA